MKFVSSTIVALSALVAVANAQCTESTEQTIEMATKLAFAGYAPAVNRITNTGEGNKIVLRGYAREPVIETDGDSITITAGEPCDPVVVEKTTTEETPSAEKEGEASEAMDEGFDIMDLSSAASSFLGFSVPLFFGKSMGLSSGMTGALMTTLALTSSSRGARAEECVDTLAPIEVDIYVDTTANDVVMLEAQSGDWEVCPPETLYWKHHPDVFNGFEGCVGEKGYYPCSVDSQGVWEEDGELAAKYPINWNGTACVETGYTTENRTFWILWGDPLDKYELNKRTGFNPVVSFPFNRGPYPRYEQGVSVDVAIDDSSDARAAAKDFLVYIGAFTAEELEAFDVTFTEGAESGMTHIWAGKALEIARTTCNRDIYALMEVPAYGYSPSDAADIVNKFSSSFYNSSECLCFETDSCLEPTVTISNRGWLPLTPFPIENGGDGIAYSADSESTASPWMESMVFPENPSGKIKIPQLSPERRICDGVYVWPMYFGMRNYTIPMDERPDCSAWSFSITKAYSASVRAGFIIYKKEPESNHAAMVDTISTAYTMTHGLFSEWSWYGQMQLWDMMMSKPLSDPTSWIGAYSEIMEEKWSVVIDAFAGCPVTEPVNPRAGAYAWFVYKEPYVGLQDGFVSSFFRDVLGIRTTTYNWGFRGADPADFYGENYGVADFTRLQLYRDASVYEEVARRAAIVCADQDAVIGDFISVNQWVTASEAVRARRLAVSDGEPMYESKDHRARHLSEALPEATEAQIDYLVNSHEESAVIDEKVAKCAPDFSMSCLFKQVGNRFADM